MNELNESLARKVLEVVDHGLVSGMGQPIPGQMCVEAAVCFAYGLKHSDNPPCVGIAVRRYKIFLNDSCWSNDAARAKGLRALAIAQLGSNEIDQAAFSKAVAEGGIRRVLPVALRSVATLFQEPHKAALIKAADTCEKTGTAYAAGAAGAAHAAHAADAARAAARAAAYAAAYAAHAARAAAHAADAARAAAYAARAAAYAADAARAAAYAAAYAAAHAADEVLNIAADVALQALIELKSPGCEYLWLLEN